MSIIYNPQRYKLPDVANQNFIDSQEITDILEEFQNPTQEQVRETIAKSMAKQRLSMQETAILVNTTDPQLVEEIKQAARQLKEKVYGKRIVLFAPLYIGNLCINNCAYCGFRSDNKLQKRTSLTTQELIEQVKARERAGHNRRILVYGQRPK